LVAGRRRWCRGSRIAAEGAEDVGGGFVAVEEVRWGAVVRVVPDERDHLAFALVEIGARLREGSAGASLVVARPKSGGGAQCRIGLLPGGRS
jgi:hypothetical protein